MCDLQIRWFRATGFSPRGRLGGNTGEAQILHGPMSNTGRDVTESPTLPPLPEDFRR